MATRKITTPKFRVGFPSVFKKNGMPGTPETQWSYNVHMIFSKKENLSELKAIIQEAIQEKWGGKVPAKLELPFKSGEEKVNTNGEGYDGFDDSVVFCVAKSKSKKPIVVDQQCQPILDESEIYGGCFAIGSVNAFAWEFAGKKGVSIGLLGLQKYSDGDPMGGAVCNPNVDFAPLGDVPDNKNQSNQGGIDLPGLDW